MRKRASSNSLRGKDLLCPQALDHSHYGLEGFAELEMNAPVVPESNG